MNSDFAEISETIKLANLYIENLKSLNYEIRSVQEQVESTYQNTTEEVARVFANLKSHINKMLDLREKELLKQAEDIKNEGMKPLKQCAKIIETSIKNTTDLIDEGSSIDNKDQRKIINFLEKANILGNLPEVPDSAEVPCISFYHEPNIGIEVEGICSTFGEIYRVAPVQIQSIIPKPGAVLINWHQSFEHNDDRIRDIQEFQLQRAIGDLTKNKTGPVNFIECYRGTETHFLLRDILISQPYSFRVCCKFDGTESWSPWSIVRVGMTKIPWFSWKSTEATLLTNEGKIAALKSDKNGRVFSSGPQVSVGDSVEFTILEADKSSINLSLVPAISIDSANINQVSCILNNEGKITLDGSEKSTILEPFSKGLKVCFSLEKVSQQKIRVNLDCNEKRVTYDWLIDCDSKFYFACEMSSSRWKVMVE